MYERFFGFKLRPFALNPDPAFLFPSRQHAMALTLLEYGIESQATFGLLTGEVGSGKTTLLRRIIRDLGQQVAVGFISNSHPGFRSMHSWAISALGIVPADDSEVALYEALVDSFIREYGRGRRTLLIVDEAQNLGIDVLEELRLLSNVNSEQDVVLQVLLVGQPELRTTLARPELRQLAQRMSIDFHLRSLDGPETAQYIRHRLAAAGGTEDIFEPAACDLVFDWTAGIPRLINQLCDMALVYAYAGGQHRVESATLDLVLRDRARAEALPVLGPRQLQGAGAQLGA